MHKSRTSVAALAALAVLTVACSPTAAAPAPPTSATPPTAVTSSTAPVTTTSPTTTAAPITTTSSTPPTTVAAPCPSLDSSFTGAVAGRDLAEISGLAASRAQDGVLWAHGDSGAEPVIHALAPDGSRLAAFRLAGAHAVDWEDVALGPGPEELDYLYVGDIGDNRGTRSEIVVYRVAEPVVPADPIGGVQKLDGVESFRLRYPADPYDAETLLVDPASGDLYIVTKDIFGESTVFRAAAPLADGVVLEETATLSLGIGGFATAGDMSRAGDLVAIRTYTAVFLWRRAAGDGVPEALGEPPCVFPVLNEAQGEALTFSGTGGALYTTSEGAEAPIQRHDLSG